MFEEASRGLETEGFWQHAQRCYETASRLYSDSQMDDDARLCDGLATMLSRFRHDRVAQHHPGHIVNGDFLIYYARKGGMGTVYFCRDMHSDQPVVLKTFQREDSMDPRARGRFLQECAVWLLMQKHSHVVRAKELILDHDDKDRPYLVIEYIPGRSDVGSSLTDHLCKRGRLPVETALKYAIHVCYGMHYASSVRPDFVHRDLKPDNILITSDDIAKVTDFGLASAGLPLDLEVSFIIDKTPVQRFDPFEFQREANRPPLGPAGTLPYIPPEAWTSQEVDIRGDVYSFGCVLFEMLAGRSLFPLLPHMNWRDAHTRMEPLRLLDVGVTVPHAIQAIVSRCLSKMPQQRYQNFSELSGELARCFEEFSGRAAPTLPEPVPLTVSEMERLAISLAEVGLPSESIELLEAVIAQEPAMASHRYNLGKLYQDRGDLEKAMESYKQAISLDSNISQAWFNMGLCLGQLGCMDEAKDALRRAVELGHSCAQQALDAFDEGGVIIIS